MIIRSILAAAGAATLLSFATPANAEMGSSPVAPGGSYLSIFGGFFDTNIDFGPRSCFRDRAQTKRRSTWMVTVSAVSMFGFTPTNGLSWIDRVEWFFEFGGGDDKVSETNVPFRIVDVTGVYQSSAGALTAKTKRDFDYYEFGFRLRNDNQNIGGHVLPVFIEPFLRFTEDDTSTQILSQMLSTRNREGDVDAWFLGFMAGVDPELHVSQSVKLVASLAAGLYYVDADGKFRSTANNFALFNQSFNDDEDAIGFRGRAQGAIKFALTQAAIVSLFAGVDYWSDVPVAYMPNNIGAITTPQGAAHVDMEDVVEVKGGARLTIALDALGIGN